MSDDNEDRAKRDSAGRFGSGNSANPSGRPRVIKELLDSFRDVGDLTYLRGRLMELAKGDDLRVAMAAIKEWHDRAYGKAPQAVTGPEGEALNLGVVVLPALDSPIDK